MSGRGATGDVIQELAQPLNRPVHLLELDFQPFIYLTDGPVDLAWNGNTYLASQFLGVSGIQETAELLVNDLTITLSGVDQSVLSLLLLETYFFRRVRIRRAFLDADLALISEPVLLFEGRMTKPAAAVDELSGTCTASVECASIWADFERTGGRRTSDPEQQHFFPGDRGFDRVLTIPRRIPWNWVTEVKRPAPNRRIRP